MQSFIASSIVIVLALRCLPGSASARMQRREPSLTGICRLVHRLLNPLGFAGGQLAVFQGGPSRTGGKAPLSAS